jgi:hypothetical protein
MAGGLKHRFPGFVYVKLHGLTRATVIACFFLLGVDFMYRQLNV